jgi:WD40 repeat protein
MYKKILFILFCCIFSISIIYAQIDPRGLIVEELAQRNVAVFPQLGHTGRVYSVAFSPDGKYILSGGRERTIKLWDAATGREIRSFSGYTLLLELESGDPIIFSPDGRYILSTGDELGGEGTIILWDTATGDKIQVISTYFRVNSLAFSPDGKYFISNSHDLDDENQPIGIIKLWDIATGQEIQAFSDYASALSTITFTPDGKNILAGYTLFDIATSQVVRTFPSYGPFSPDGRYIVSEISNSGCLGLYDVATGKEIRTFLGHTGIVDSVAFSPDGRQIVSGSLDKTIKLWDVATGKEIRTFFGHIDGVMSVAFSPDGRRIVSGSWDKTIKLWDVVTGREISNLLGYTEMATAVAFSPDDRHALCGYGDGTIKLWDITTGREIRTFSGHTDIVNTVLYSPDGKQIISGSYDNNIKLWDAVTGREIRTISVDRYFFNSLFDLGTIILTPDGKYIISNERDKPLSRLWDLTTGREIQDFPRNYLYDISFSPDGRYILFHDYNRNIHLYDVTTSQIRTFFLENTNRVFYVTFSPDGKQIISGSGYTSNYDTIIIEGCITLWDVATGQKIRTFSEHAPRFVTFSPDGKHFISSDFKEIKILDTVTGRLINTFFISEHIYDFIYYIEFSPDSNYILTKGEYISKLWDISTGRKIQTFSTRYHIENNIAFSSDGKKLLSASIDGAVHHWETATGKEIAQFVSFTNTGTQLAGRGLVVEEMETASNSEWIVITPDGYYDASPKGDRHLNVRVGNTVTGIDSYRSTFYNQQIVQARLQGLPDPVHITHSIENAASFIPPIVEILSPVNRAGLSTGQVELSVVINDQNQPLRNIRVLVNGRLLGRDELQRMRGSQGLTVIDTGINISSSEKRVEFRVPITLTAGNNRIEVFASNPNSVGQNMVEVIYQPTGIVQQAAPPNLWILAIGINRYDSPLLRNLNFAVNDARAIIDIFKTQEGKVYGKVNSLLIADGAGISPTTENIINNFRYLRQAGPQDVVLLFIAGHGLNDEDGNFWFMPSDASFDANQSILPSRAISHRQIQTVLDRPGQKLVFIDSCHSSGTGSRTGRVDNNNLVRSLQNESTVIFTSSRGNEESLESRQFGHGIFTYTILQGLRGEAFPEDGIISMMALELYVRREVPKLTDRAQNPTTYRPNGFDDFIVARSP